MKIYDHYIALDWAQSNMALAHMTKHSHDIKTIDVRSDIEALRAYLEQLKGTKILTFEESSPAHWLYTELIEHVDEIIVCEPYANHLLKHGPKTDRTDAIKLLKLLRANMLKPVFHCTDDFVKIRKLVSAYDDLITAIVIDPRRFNHKTALWLYCGLQKYELISGNRSYGKRSPRYSRRLKCVFKTAALAATRTKDDNPLKKLYQELIELKKYPEHQARHALARRIATLTLGVMRRGEKLNFDELNNKMIAS